LLLLQTWPGHRDLIKINFWMRQTKQKVKTLKLVKVNSVSKEKKIRTRRVYEPSTSHAKGVDSRRLRYQSSYRLSYEPRSACHTLKYFYRFLHIQFQNLNFTTAEGTRTIVHGSDLR
jgi:hypothetical protein